ncbi:hypothetical protein A3A79_05515 [Candidatus Gottesmanbacteria bacterium RIFCSPLOWO2_01_FULL_43_11b]|uniref:Uncharacterized protein n=1 Tax=Candidatus Gottesmanbacteria bacterium RIFCSPLOWO2_01_FULL_43_11b TaxID=1798392 RepID=A0A1F6AIU5_9BACT|nr:MAG: hypothetical protein A3A79_05515 [Candidatus Gottesmanbacteria bacterium RIFCSPLOWO2_01_FULL_43_11b]
MARAHELAKEWEKSLGELNAMIVNEVQNARNVPEGPRFSIVKGIKHGVIATWEQISGLGKKIRGRIKKS